MGRTACTEPQCLYSTAIPLLIYRPYGLYRASVTVQYSYTSTPPIGRTVCTEPQCLYSTAIPLLPLWAIGLYRASVPLQYSYTSTPLWAVRPVQSPSTCTCVHSTFTFTLLEREYNERMKDVFLLKHGSSFP